MKKITFIFLLLIIPIVSMGQDQVFDFTGGSNGNWVAWQGSETVTNTGSALKCDYVSASSTGIANTSANIDAANRYMVVKFKNNSSDNRGFYGAAINTSPPNAFQNIRINTSDTGFTTHVIDLGAHSAWPGSGTVPEIRVYIRSLEGGGTLADATAGSFEIENITFTANKPSREEFKFNAGDGIPIGFIPESGNSSFSSEGFIFTPTANFARIKSSHYVVDADTYKYLHIRVKNEGENDLIIVNTEISPTGLAGSVNISKNDTGFNDYVLDLTGSANWSGTAEGIRIYPRQSSNNWADTNTANGNNVTFEYVIFSNSATLSIDDVRRNDKSISVFPNPTSSIVNIKTPLAVNKIEVYNLLGQKALERSESKSLDISALTNGIYILKIYQDNNDVVSTKRFVKQ